MMLYGVMYSYQLLKKRECFKMKMFYIFLILISVNISSDSLYGLENEANEIRFNNLIKDIRCPKCTSGSLSSSNAPISEDLKLKIVLMIQEGKTDQEIKDYVTSRFGKESLYEPEFNNSTYILWLAPFVVLFLALFIFISRKKT